VSPSIGPGRWASTARATHGGEGLVDAKALFACCGAAGGCLWSSRGPAAPAGAPGGVTPLRRRPWPDRCRSRQRWPTPVGARVRRQALTNAELGQLLWQHRDHRPARLQDRAVSRSALPLEVYVVTTDACFTMRSTGMPWPWSTRPICAGAVPSRPAPGGSRPGTGRVCDRSRL